eukprot:m.120003 g.120003  ORF g.120003 m.120003 type:complete len:927 (-) comp15602_c0_seq17:397-3177(-)
MPADDSDSSDADSGTRQCGFCAKIGRAEEFFARTKRFCSHSCCSKHNRMAPAERKIHAESLGLEYQPSPSPRIRKKRGKIPLQSRSARLRSTQSTPAASRTASPVPRRTSQSAHARPKHGHSKGQATSTPSKLKGQASKRSKPKPNPESANTQVFTTEFVSRMRVDDLVNLADYQTITDRWINRYNEPTQVPSGYLEQLQREDPVEVGRAHELREYQRPKAYHRLRESEEGAYDMDHEDEAWLQLYHEQVDPELSHAQVEAAIYAFEHTAYELLRNNPKSIEYDASTRCDICGQLESEEGNEMVFCDGCDVAVHQVCYGIPTIPQGSWYCNACSRREGQSVPCALCPNIGGALKQSTNPRQWAHLSCVVWTPEAVVGDTDIMEPVDIRGVPKERYNLQCSVCESKNGSCIQCVVPSCTTAFHVTCAIKERLRLDVVIPPNGDVSRLAYCRRHSQLKRTDPTGSVVQHVTQPSMHTDPGYCNSYDVYHQIKLEDLDLDPVIEMATLKRIFAYWALKRRKQQGRPLMRRFTPKPPVRTKATKGNSPRVLRHRLQEERLSLERLRSLCEQVRRRETKKRELLCVQRREFALSAESHRQTLQLEPTELCGPNSRWNADVQVRRRWEIRGLEEASSGDRVPHKDLLKQRLFALIEKVKAHRAAKPFLFPVNTDAYPDYRKLIKTPIDISTIYSRVLSDHYATFQSLADDMGLVFTNCYNYNAKESDVWKQAKRLQSFFNKQAAKYVAELEEASRSDADDSPALDEDDDEVMPQLITASQEALGSPDNTDDDDDDDDDDNDDDDADNDDESDHDDADNDDESDDDETADTSDDELEEIDDDDEDEESGSEASPTAVRRRGKRLVTSDEASSSDEFERTQGSTLSKRAKALEAEVTRFKPRHVCSHCDKRFRSGAQLERHAKVHLQRKARQRR